MQYAYDGDGRVLGAAPLGNEATVADWQAQGHNILTNGDPEPQDINGCYVDSGTLATKTPVSITADKTTIIADGVDAATLTVAPLVAILIDGVEFAAGVITSITAATPGVTTVEVADNIRYMGDALEIEAE